MTCNTYDAPTTKYSTSVLTTDQLASQFYNFSQLTDVQNDPAKSYDPTKLTTVSSYTTILIQAINNKPSLSLSYPFLTKRLTQGNITNTELANFLNTSAIDIDTIQASLNTDIQNINASNYNISADTKTYLSQIDSYYNATFPASISGGFCSIYTGALTSIIALVGGAATLLSDLTSLPSTIVTKLSELKSIFNNIIDDIVKTAKSTISNIASQIANLKNVALSMITHLSQELKKVNNFFSDLNINNIKSKIESIMAQLAGSFENLTLDNLSYILFRMCQLTDVITAFMNSPINGITTLLSTLKTQRLIFGNISTSSKYSLSSAGLQFLDNNYINDAKQAAASRINQPSSLTSNTTAPSVYITLKDLSPDELSVGLAIHTASPADILSGNFYGSDRLKFDPQVVNQPYQSSEGVGYKNMDLRLLGLLARVAGFTGSKLYITSGYRNPTYNATLPGAAKGSFHTTGQAADVLISSMARGPSDYIKTLSQQGFGGIGTYPTFIHADIGPRRIWTTNNSYWNELLIHKNDGYRTNSTNHFNSPQ